GDYRYQFTNVPPNVTGVTAVSTGFRHTLTLQSDGKVLGWGEVPVPAGDVPAGLGEGVLSIAAGGEFSLAVKSNGTVAAWGDNSRGQISGATNLTGVVAVTAGYLHAAALRSDGTVVAWGDNSREQTNVPAGLTNVTAIAAGDFHTMALRSDGTVVAWGDDTRGQTSVPPGINGVTAIAAGSSNSVVVLGPAAKSFGPDITLHPNDQMVLRGERATFTAEALGFPKPVLAWQQSRDGGKTWENLPERNGFGGTTTATLSVYASALFPGETWFRLTGTNTAGVAFTSVAKLTIKEPLPGVIIAWGDADLGLTNIPAGLSGIRAISAGRTHAAAVLNNGTVVAWGLNDHGQTSVPEGLNNVTSVAAGADYTMALRADGNVVTWGRDLKPPPGLNSIVAISAGLDQAAAVKQDGTVIAWGYNSYGLTNPPAGLGGVIAVAEGALHALALKSDGSVVAWGDNSHGQTDVPAGLGDVVAIAAQVYNSAALKRDGTVVVWGDNTYGQTKGPAGLADVVAIAGGERLLALKRDGTVVGWGHDWITPPAGLAGVTAISSGGALLAIVASNSLARPPVFTVDPVDQALTVGQTASFAGAVEANPDPSFQWQRSVDKGVTWKNLADGAGTTGAMTGTLRLSGVTTNMTGQQFRLTATNSVAGTVSVNATLRVVKEFRLKVEQSDSGVILTVIGQAGATYLIESSDTLSPPVWQTVGSVKLLGSVQYWSDDFSPDRPERFYRMVLP
ncbi:MAG TPA: hypothetical protein VHH73_00840, partial [Verrucomicrobiae bacterium]|nr:hypothetical protein [Verrucomicrobiae bacterium]